MAFNAASVYQQTNINTASPAELTLMLYDGAIKFCNIALLAIEKKDLEKCNYNIQKAKAIIDQLRSTLDFKYSVAKDFDRVYDYISWILIQANIKKDPLLIEEGLQQIREMRDTWKEIIKKTKTASA